MELIVTLGKIDNFQAICDQFSRDVGRQVVSAIEKAIVRSKYGGRAFWIEEGRLAYARYGDTPAEAETNAQSLAEEMTKYLHRQAIVELVQLHFVYLLQGLHETLQQTSFNTLVIIPVGPITMEEVRAFAIRHFPEWK